LSDELERDQREEDSYYREREKEREGISQPQKEELIRQAQWKGRRS
jgi:hypothetical protein